MSNQSDRAPGLRARLWSLTPKRWQWRMLWAVNPKFNVGLAVVVTDPEGRVLVLRHTYRTGHEWGLPTGWMRRNETFEQAITREVHEETGLDITVGELLAIESGYRLRVELIFAATTAPHARHIAPRSNEVREALFATIDDLPAGLAATHRHYIALACRPIREGALP